MNIEICFYKFELIKHIYNLICHIFQVYYLFYQSIVDLQCCVKFQCIAKIYIILQILFHYMLL